MEKDTYSTRDEVTAFLKLASLRQYPPCTRTVQVVDPTMPADSRNEQWIRHRFPHLSFGEVVMRGRALIPLVFWHDRPWEDLDDAIDVLNHPGVHTYGIIGFCLGARAHNMIRDGKISTEDAFWQTTFFKFFADPLSYWGKITVGLSGMKFWSEGPKRVDLLSLADHQKAIAEFVKNTQDVYVPRP